MGELEPDHSRVISDRRRDGVEVGWVDRGECEPVAPEDLVKQAEGAAVHVLGEDDVVAGIEQERHRGGRGQP